MSEMSDTDRMLTRLYQAAAEIGNQWADSSAAAGSAESAMLGALWNDCQGEIKKVQESDDDSFENAEAFLGLLYSGSS